MQHQGVHYDTGTVFRGPGYAISTRRSALDMSVVRRELASIFHSGRGVPELETRKCLV
jgi:hypothetical protein